MRKLPSAARSESSGGRDLHSRLELRVHVGAAGSPACFGDAQESASLFHQEITAFIAGKNFCVSLSSALCLVVFLVPRLCRCSRGGRRNTTASFRPRLEPMESFSSPIVSLFGPTGSSLRLNPPPSRVRPESRRSCSR